MTPKCGLSPSGKCQDRTCEECAKVGPFNSIPSRKTTVDVTQEVTIGEVDDDLTYLKQCICGRSWAPWNKILHINEADSTGACDECGRKFYFTVKVQVWEVRDV